MFSFDNIHIAQFSFLLDGLIVLRSNDEASIGNQCLMSHKYTHYPHSCSSIHRKCISVVFAFFFFLVFFFSLFSFLLLLFSAFESSERSSLSLLLSLPLPSLHTTPFLCCPIHTQTTFQLYNWMSLAGLCIQDKTGQSVISSRNLIYLHLMTCEKLINLSSFVSQERSAESSIFLIIIIIISY